MALNTIKPTKTNLNNYSEVLEHIMYTPTTYQSIVWSHEKDVWSNVRNSLIPKRRLDNVWKPPRLSLRRLNITWYFYWNAALVYLSSLWRVWRYLTRIGKSKDRQHNGQTKKDKRTNNDLQSTAQKTNDRAPRTWGWTKVLWKGKQFLLYLWYSLCYSSLICFYIFDSIFRVIFIWGWFVS